MKTLQKSRKSVILLAIFVPAILGLAGTYVAVRVSGEYALALFMALPFEISFLSAFIVGRHLNDHWGYAYLISLYSILATGGMILLVALDGLICLIMAVPLAVLMAVPASALGFWLARKLPRRAAGILPLLLIVAFPGFLGFEQKYPNPSPVHEVTSSVRIAAPIETVWEDVIAFDRITKPPGAIFRLGIAYPIQARIEGRGVGAIRHCIFSTGPFVEPITTWQPPHRLEFDVTSNPPPMRELSPFGPIETPHLHGTFVSHHGRFRLEEKDGYVLLEGTTWYTQHLAPDWYWWHFSNEIIHQIHLRVLDQIKQQAEARR